MKFFKWLSSFFSSPDRPTDMTERANNKQLTDADMAAARQAYEAENAGRSFDDDLAAALKANNEAEQQRNNEHAQALAEINRVLPGVSNNEKEGNLSAEENNHENTAHDGALLAGVQRMTAAFEQMAARAANPTPVDVATPVVNINGPGTNATHFLGIPHSMFSLNKRWNKISANPGYALTHSIEDELETYAADFRTAVRSFGKGVMDRFQYLFKNGMLETVCKNAFSNDYSGLSDAKLGDRYIVRRQDAIIARLMQRADIYKHFPRRFGVQDSELMLSAFFTEVSQAWQRGEVFKGSMDLQPELGIVDDAMIKLAFPPMEEIERLYIAYTNKEFSDPMKWSMIEYQYSNIMETAISEQFHRKIMGIYVHPEKGVPGSYLTSSTGLIYTLVRYYHENKLLPFTDSAFSGYTDATILDVVQDYCKKVKESVDKDKTIKFKNLVLFINSKDDVIWKQAIRARFGKDTDFSGPDSYLHRVPDFDTRIVWLENLDNLQILFMEEPGNIQFLENKPGEMFAAKMFERFEEILFSSRWKEGTSAEFVGRKFNNIDELKANNLKMQRLFINRPCSYLSDGETTADADKGFWFITDNNSAATELTIVQNAVKGVAYIIETEGENNPTQIKQAAMFSEISSDFIPTKQGDYLMFILNEAGDKYLELERRVGGQRTINVKLQPNIPGAR